MNTAGGPPLVWPYDNMGFFKERLTVGMPTTINWDFFFEEASSTGRYKRKAS